MDIQGLAKELEFEEEDVVMLVEVFVQTARENVEVLKKSIEAKDFDTTRRAAHSIKGSGANLFFEHIVQNALVIEENAAKENDIEYMPYLQNINEGLNSIESKML